MPQPFAGFPSPHTLNALYPGPITLNWRAPSNFRCARYSDTADVVPGGGADEGGSLALISYLPVLKAPATFFLLVTTLLLFQDGMGVWALDSGCCWLALNLGMTLFYPLIKCIISRHSRTSSPPSSAARRPRFRRLELGPPRDWPPMDKFFAFLSGPRNYRDVGFSDTPKPPTPNSKALTRYPNREP